MNLIGFQAYGTKSTSSTSASEGRGAKTAGCGSCRDTRMAGARTGATSWASFTASAKKTLTPQFKLWPTIHVGTEARKPSAIRTEADILADGVSLVIGGVASGAAGYFIGGATKSTWIPVVSGSLLGAMTRIGIILGGVIAYAGVHYARK